MGAAGHQQAFAAELAELPNLLGKTRAELQHIFQELGFESYRAKQVWRWLYVKGAENFSQMSDLAKPAREKLDLCARISRLEEIRRQVSTDGTAKFLLRTADNKEIETVYIPETDRGTLCVSSQVGCTLTCRFCHTGTQKLVRNLTAAEIIGQLIHVKDYLGDWQNPNEQRRLTNIVFMGMGEPLYNMEEVSKAIGLMTDPEGLSVSKRRITVSTAGVVPQIAECGALGVNLAVSFHATNDELRNKIMPINKKYPIAELLEACRQYPGLSNARRITFEYVMLKGVNDSLEEAKALIALLNGIPTKMNLIPFNPWPGSEFESSSPERVNQFATILMDAGYASPIRTPRGRDILAACGQLRSETIRQAKYFAKTEGAKTELEEASE
ncbi:MAG: 23S rRNA (adenine(2503)-C(2))-methyltransferase RlmN [Alphaproteobacteria bacterium]